MRWRSPAAGDMRLVTRFLLFPKQLGLEWRWLEWATWKQRLVYDVTGDAVDWVDVHEWLDVVPESKDERPT